MLVEVAQRLEILLIQVDLKRLRDLARPQYRLRVGEIRVFYDVLEREVWVHAILFKPKVEEWLKEVGKPS